MSPVDRRGFLGAVAGAFVASTTRLRGLARVPTAVPRQAAAPALATYFADPAAVARIGAAYLAVAPADGDADLLLTELAPEGSVPADYWATVAIADLQVAIRDAVHADFEAGDIVDIGGWQLARTEARLAALSTLL